MTKAALISGATGFVGGALARRLIDDGWTVAAVVREGSDPAELTARGVRICRFDGTVDTLCDIVKSARPDVVFHLASLYLAGHRPDQVAALTGSNIGFPTQLLEAMTVAGATRLVNTGTSWQHGGPSFDEPVNLYAATKQAFEAVLRYYVVAHGLSAITLKLFDTYGEGDPRRKVVQLLVDAARSGETLDMSPGEQIVDLTHVDDVVDAFLAAAKAIQHMAPADHREFFVSGERYRVRELAELVERSSDHALSVNFGGRPYRPREVMMPITAEGRSVPGWRRRRNLADEIRRLLRA